MFRLGGCLARPADRLWPHRSARSSFVQSQPSRGPAFARGRIEDGGRAAARNGAPARLLLDVAKDDERASDGEGRRLLDRRSETAPATPFAPWACRSHPITCERWSSSHPASPSKRSGESVLQARKDEIAVLSVPPSHASKKAWSSMTSRLQPAHGGRQASTAQVRFKSVVHDAPVPALPVPLERVDVAHRSGRRCAGRRAIASRSSAVEGEGEDVERLSGRCSA